MTHHANRTEVRNPIISVHAETKSASDTIQHQLMAKVLNEVGLEETYLNIIKVDCGKAFDCVDHNKLWKILKEMGIPDHLTCLLRNLYAGQEATVRTGHGTTDWFQIGNEVHQGCVLSLCLFNLYANYIMRNTGLEEVQAGIKIAGRNLNNLRYVYDTTLYGRK